MRRLNSFIIIALFLTSSCVQNTGLSKNRKVIAKNITAEEIPEGNQASDGERGAGPFDGTFTGNENDDLSLSKVELRHFIDPFEGTYKTKIAIPKNYEGFLYISGLNITSLSDRLVSVRFRFGRELEVIDVPAVIGRAPGITPQTDIEVLQLDFSKKPFENLRLLYNLYDYNDYRDMSGNEDFLDSNNQATLPTQDPYNTGLYCRGLRLEHDPTFRGSATNTDCDVAGEKCLYAYAKITDSGLVDQDDNFLAIIPELQQIDFSKLGYSLDTESNNLLKCLPDNNNLANLKSVLGATSIGANQSSVGYGDIVTMESGTQYTYRGPFRPIGQSNWEIKGDALFTEVNASVEGTGLFQLKQGLGNVDSGYRSFLFPRTAKLDLKAGVQYFGSSAPMDTKSLKSLITSGRSEFMDGCNLRVATYDSIRGEDISSCNITATLELITIQDGREVSLLEKPNIALKLHVIRASQTNFRGEEVLYTSLKTCKNNNACGANECCFNERCWGKELVSQCLEDSPDLGNRGVGQECNSDFQCASLCCNSATGTCAVHNTTNDEVVLCSKSPGQTCVTKEFCRLENIPTCFIVKTGQDPLGKQECALRCYNTPTFGTCRSGICIPPSVPSVPSFDPTNPDCSAAQEPPIINTKTGEAIPIIDLNTSGN